MTIPIVNEALHEKTSEQVNEKISAKTKSSTGNSTEKTWWVYMIRTQGGQLYTGITTDIQRRWHEHLTGKGGARYFRGHKLQNLAYIEQQPDRSCASKREAELKKMPKLVKENLVRYAHIPDEFKLIND